MNTQPHRHSTIVIGSGFGGAVAASALVDTGEKVLLLERGPWRDTNAIKAAGIENRASLPVGWRTLNHLLHKISLPITIGNGVRLFRRGLFDIHLDSQMSVVCSSGVGGGSHVYSAMNTRPENKDYWDNRVDNISSDAMEPHYAWILERMGAQKISASDRVPNWTSEAFAISPNFVADDTVAQPDLSVRLNGLDQDYRNNSYFGSANGAKMTLDRALLLPAIEKGLQIAAEHECLSLWALSEGGYRLEVLDHGAKRRRYLLADRVILAAGTLNTLRLLFHSRAITGLSDMPALGQGFSGNGDSVAWWALNEKGADLSLGTPTHGRFALRDRATGNALPGPYITRFGFNGIDTLPLPKWLKVRLRRDAILVGMGADKADGIAQWVNGKLSFKYNAENSGVFADIQQFFAEVAHRSKRPVRFLKNRPLTVHPLGGARLAKAEAEGVVDGTGQVFGFSELYITDASALPSAPGTPPSMTIAAWARHVATSIAVRANASNQNLTNTSERSSRV